MHTRDIVAATLIGALLAGCTAGSINADQRGPASPAPSPRELGSVSGGNSRADFQFFFRNFDDYVSQSSAVFEGEVISESRGAVNAKDEYREQVRVLQIRVRDALSGFQPSTAVVRVDDFGWRQVRGKAEEVDRPQGYLRLEVGDVGVFSVLTTDKRVYGFVNDQSVFLLNGDEVRDTDRQDPFVRDAERLSTNDLRDRIREAAVRNQRTPS